LQYSEGANDISQQLLQGTDSVIWDCPGGFQVNTSLTTAPSSGCSNPLTVGQFILIGQALGFTPVQLAKALFDAGILNLSIVKGVYLNKTLRGGVTWTRGKNTLGLNIFDVKRIFQDIGGLPGDETRGITGLYGYRLDPRTTLNTTLSFTNNIVPALLSGLATDRNDHTYVASIGLTRQFQPKLTGSLIYRYTIRHSNDSAFDFTENNLTALVNKTF
jgi:uncharacterized protein (PEP-CTERM system associated)